MPKAYPASRQPENLANAEASWDNAEIKGREKFRHEIREAKEFSVADIQGQLTIIYGFKPEDYASVNIKKETSGFLENVELHLKQDVSIKLFGHLVSFDFTVEGRVTPNTQATVTNISRNDFYEDGDVRGESLADYDRTTGEWKVQPNILKIKGNK